MIKTNANEDLMTPGHKDAMDKLEWHLRGTLLSSLPGATIEMDRIDFGCHPYCALELIEKCGVDYAIEKGLLDGELTFRIGSPASPYQYACKASIIRIHVIHSIMKNQSTQETRQ